MAGHPTQKSQHGGSQSCVLPPLTPGVKHQYNQSSPASGSPAEPREKRLSQTNRTTVLPLGSGKAASPGIKSRHYRQTCSSPLRLWSLLPATCTRCLLCSTSPERESWGDSTERRQLFPWRGGQPGVGNSEGIQCPVKCCWTRSEVRWDPAPRCRAAVAVWGACQRTAGGKGGRRHSPAGDQSKKILES